MRIADPSRCLISPPVESEPFQKYLAFRKHEAHRLFEMLAIRPTSYPILTDDIQLTALVCLEASYHRHA